MNRSRIKPKISPDARVLLRLLENRHFKDVFVSECKDGPTQSVSSYLRMDGWSMARSWANPLVCAYEIKVSRSDFIADNKWPGYLPYCNQFYCVTPKNLIDLSEIPEQAGLLVAVGQGAGGRLITQKKAPYRDVVIPESSFRYVLMCRAQITDDPEPIPKQDHWREWLGRKAEDQKLGHEVAKRIRERATELEIENTRLRRAMQNYDSIKVTLTQLGFGDNYIPDSWSFEQRMTKHRSVFTPELVRELRSARNVLEAALNRIQAIEAQGSEGDDDLREAEGGSLG